MKITTLLFLTITPWLLSCSRPDPNVRTIAPEILKDKIAGGWAGKIIGVTYGAPTEFHALGKTFEDSIRWNSVGAP